MVRTLPVWTKWLIWDKNVCLSDSSLLSCKAPIILYKSEQNQALASVLAALKNMLGTSGMVQRSAVLICHIAN